MECSNKREEDGSASDTGVYRTTFDWSSTDPSTGIVEAVADATDYGALALDPLYEAVDPDALGSLLRSGEEGLSVSFGYTGREVTVCGDGRVAVHPSGSDET